MTLTGIDYCKKCHRNTEHAVDLGSGSTSCLTCHPPTIASSSSGSVSSTLAKGNKYHAVRKHEEADLDKSVLEVAHLFGYLAVHSRPAWSKEGKCSTPLMGDSGAPDWLLARKRDHRIVFIETKSSKGKFSKEQKAWQKAIGDMEDFEGGEYYVVRPQNWDEIIEALK